MHQLAILMAILPICVTAQSGYFIEGLVKLSDDWNPVIYMSVIDAMDDMTSVSGDMIIAQAPISEDGSFALYGEYLQEQNRLYRLHVSKRGDPPSTIIIGGKEENHVHFAMAPGDTVHVEHRDSSLVFAGLEVQGNLANECLGRVHDILAILRYQSSGSAAGVRLKRGEVRSRFEQELRRCENPLGKLYAAHILMEKFEDAALIEYLLVTREIKALQSSPYYDDFARRVELAALHYGLLSSRSAGWWQWLLLLPLVAGIWWFVMHRRRQSPEVAMLSLSMQERRVLELLVMGLTNKEISSELNIGVSTVKSHVHRIYGKLGIRSRREVHRFRHFLD